ncbi:hypothetical protein R5H30_06565 [Sulfitobacter sp. D35]|nr:hypothetical protein [Sulfitobacter sp. D35]MDW4497638.1 hypothetical protein [Sulfitobacter sp. D35]
MKAFVLAVLAAAVITAGAGLGLPEVGFSARQDATVGQSVRLDDDGE